MAEMGVFTMAGAFDHLHGSASTPVSPSHAFNKILHQIMR